MGTKRLARVDDCLFTTCLRQDHAIKLGRIPVACLPMKDSSCFAHEQIDGSSNESSNRDRTSNCYLGIARISLGRVCDRGELLSEDAPHRPQAHSSANDNIGVDMVPPPSVGWPPISVLRSARNRTAARRVRPRRPHHTHALFSSRIKT